MRTRALIAAVLLTLIVVAAFALPVKDWLGVALAWSAEHRKISSLLFIALYVIATVSLLPGLILTVSAGAIFGLAYGTLLVSIGSVLGATAAFFLGRTLARDWIRTRIETWPKVRALDHALGARGFWIVLLTRLSPVLPFNLLNYLYGTTAVRPRDYIIGSWIGMFPATVVYVYTGSAAASLAQALAGHVESGRLSRALLWIGLAATIAVTALVTRIAHHQLERELAT